MQNEKTVTVVFDTRNEDFENGKQWQSLLDQVSAVMQPGIGYSNIEITQWQLYHEGNLVRSGEDTHIPFYRHFYYDPKQNKFGGGFAMFEMLDDLHRYYPDFDVRDKRLDTAEFVFTVTVTLP